MIEYSYCTTVYNSREIINDFLNSLSLHLEKNSELVIVDNMSRDGTYEEILKFSYEHPNVIAIQEPCTRGRGRKLAVEKASGEIIIMLDVDEIITAQDRFINVFEKKHKDNIVLFGIDEKINGSWVGCIIGRKQTFLKLGNYPNLNTSEDYYLYMVAQRLQRFSKELMLPGEAIPLTIRGLNSGTESRYATNKLEAIVRRIKATRDGIFCSDKGFNQLVSSWNLEGFRKYFIGFPIYIIAKMLKGTVKEETVDQRVKRIMVSENYPIAENQS